MEPLFISEVKLINGKYSSNVIEVTFVGLTSKRKYTTWLDPEYRNWTNWEHIIEIAPRKGVVLSNLNLKTDKIVDADSEPRIEYVVTQEELAEIVDDYWNTKNNYRRMFGE